MHVEFWWIFFTCSFLHPFLRWWSTWQRQHLWHAPDQWMEINCKVWACCLIFLIMINFTGNFAWLKEDSLIANHENSKQTFPLDPRFTILNHMHYTVVWLIKYIWNLSIHVAIHKIFHMSKLEFFVFLVLVNFFLVYN